MEKIIQVVKFGGSSLCYDKVVPQQIEELTDSPEKFIRDRKEILRYSEEIHRAIKHLETTNICHLVISHGVKQYGHDAVGFLGVVPEVRKYVNFFSNIITEIISENLPIKQIDVSKTCKWNPQLKIFEVWDYINEIQKALDNGYIPLSWGTVVNMTQKGYEIISGDDCVLYSGLILRANGAIMYMDVPVCDKNPKIHSDARELTTIESHRDLEINVDERDKTQGLIGKIKKMKLLSMSGAKSQIVDATKDNNIYNSLLGKHVGTLITQYSRMN